MLTINIYLEIIDFGKQINGSSYPSIIRDSEIIVTKYNPTGSEDPKPTVYISPSRQKIMTRVNLYQIRKQSPFT